MKADIQRVMLSLDDPLWSDLSHAYGRAADVPALLRQLAEATGPKAAHDSEPWFSLWSCLCHQHDVFDASYAAVPHLVEMAFAASGPVDFGFFLLPASIEVARHNGRGPAVPAELNDAYGRSVERLAECVAHHRHEPWDDDMLISAMAAQAVAKGQHRIAEAIMNLDDDLIQKLINLDFNL